MKTKRLKNVLDLGNVQLHKFPLPHMKQVVHRSQQSLSNLR